MKTIRQKYLPNYTYDDYCQWEGRWELIDGIAYAMSPQPSIEHQEISLNIVYQLKNLLKKCGKCKVLLPVDWIVRENTVLQPDALVVCSPVKGKNLTETPEIIFEILSKSTKIKDKNIKYHIYQEKGVKYYIIVDPDRKKAEVYYLNNKKYEKILETCNEKITFNITDCNINFDFSEIWI